MVDGIRASFAAIRSGDTVHLSARSQGDMNVQLVLEELGGGGHYDAAGAQCTGESTEDVIAKLKAAIDLHI